MTLEQEKHCIVIDPTNKIKRNLIIPFHSQSLATGRLVLVVGENPKEGIHGENQDQRRESLAKKLLVGF